VESHYHIGERGCALRKVADCREFPSENNCSLTISGTEQEVLEAATQHAVSAHGHDNSPELREQIRGMLKDEVPVG
jgi:predicted small metal-binding protein